MPYKRAIALVSCLLACGTSIAYAGRNQTPAKKVHTVSLPSDAVLNEYGTLVVDQSRGLGFVSSVVSGSLISFSVTSGKVLSATQFGEMAGAPSMIEIGEQRLIALPMANDPEGGRPATVSIINAIKPEQPERVALIVLPPGARLRPDTRALLTNDGRFGVVASSFNAPALFSFSVETGQVVSQLALYGQPASIAMQDNAVNRTVVLANPIANNILISKLDQQGQLTAVGAFSPSDARFDYSNEPVFSADGRKVYIAASRGDRLYIVDVENGAGEGSIPISCPQRITVARGAEGAEIIGVSRLRNASGDKPGGVTVLTINKGQLTVKADFTPPDGVLLSQANNVVFSADASLAFIGSATGILFSFSTDTGKLVAYKVVGDELRSLVLSQSTRTLLAVRSTLIKDDIAVIDVDRLSENKSEVRNLSALTPEIKRISSEGTYLHILIEGTNFRKGSIVEFVKAGNVVFQQTPMRLTQGQLTIIVPAKKIEELGKFEIRVVTGTRITSDPATVEPLALLSSNATRPIQKNTGRGPSLPPASVVHSVHQRVDNNVIRVFIDTDGATKVQAFTLANPFRIVLDIIGVRSTFGNKTMQVGGPLIERIRTGQPRPGVVRVVLDAKGKVAYNVTREGGSVVVAVGDSSLQPTDRILRTRW